MAKREVTVGDLCAAMDAVLNNPQGGAIWEGPNGTLIHGDRAPVGVVAMLIGSAPGGHVEARTSRTFALVTTNGLPADAISQAEAELLYGISRAGLRSRVDKGHLTRYRVGQKSYFSRAELVRLYGENGEKKFKRLPPVPAETMPKDLISVTEATSISGLTVEGLHYRESRGLLTAYRTGGRVMFRESDIRAIRKWSKKSGTVGEGETDRGHGEDNGGRESSASNG